MLLCCRLHEFNISELSAEQQGLLLPVKRSFVGSNGKDDTETSGEWQQTTEQPKVCFCLSIRSYLHVQTVFEHITCHYFPILSPERTLSLSGLQMSPRVY